MERHDTGILKNGFIDQGDIKSQVEAAVSAAMEQWTLNQAVTEGTSVTLPDTNQDITLNLLTNGASLNAVTVHLPSNTDGRIGQRVFVNSNGNIADVTFTSTNTVNNSDVAFSPGDNFVYYRNQPTIWSRITS